MAHLVGRDHRRAQLSPRDRGIRSGTPLADRTDRQCASAEEYEGGLLGNPGLAESLCGTGPVEVGQPGPLEDQIDAAQFIGAFGPEFDQWGRAVTVESPTPMRVVLAPVGDQWVVIGVLRPGKPDEPRATFPGSAPHGAGAGTRPSRPTLTGTQGHGHTETNTT